MSIYSRKLNVSLPWAITAFFVALIGIFVLASVGFTDKPWLGKEGLLWLFALGAVPGLVVALAQFILSWAEFGEISRLRSLGVENVLLTRDDQNYYGKYIEQSSETIIVMGVTSRRFLQDFADEHSPHPHKKRLLAALDRNVAVKILIASSDYLELEQQQGYRITQERCRELKQRYPQLFDARVFDHVASQALVRIDDEVIVGPVFPRKASKDTPAVHLSARSPFARSYLDNFEYEWNQAKALNEA
ncbi:Uncharacterised protein [Burkholderia pseudomallei]|uniref:hypothetical protein n=1 Tax=Burkholderia pseudomallei TaxID=28450 RepID=UPI000F0766AC|nr:hypothetical protein [Burkholderia pseudomallei]VBW55423.1 Uncharacterised protein [Burkholderia pseudomallei]